MRRNIFNDFKDLGDFFNQKKKSKNFSKDTKKTKGKKSKNRKFKFEQTRLSKLKRDNEKKEEKVSHVFNFIVDTFDSYKSLLKYIKNMNTSSYDFNLFLDKPAQILVKNSLENVSRSYVEKNIKVLSRVVYEIEKSKNQRIKNKRKRLFTKIIYNPMGNKR